jgi:glyoxylase I family protein
VDAAFRYVREEGLDVRKPVVRDCGMKQLYLKDPDGYGLCFQWMAA